MADDVQEMQRPEGYPTGEEIEEASASNNSESSSTGNWRFFATSNDLSLLESGLLQREMEEFCGINTNGFREKLSLKPMDPRLVWVLEYFRELFVQKREVFMKIFPELLLQHEVLKLLEKFETAIAQVKMDRMRARMMQRSLSIDSPRPMSAGGDRDSPSKLDYFKIRTVYTDGGAPQGDNEGSQSK